VWRHLAGGDRNAVLARITALTTEKAGDPALARSVVDTVRATVARARDAASAGATTDVYRRAEGQLARADRLRANGQMADSLRALWQAADLYARTVPAPVAAAPAVMNPASSLPSVTTGLTPAVAGAPDPIPVPPPASSTPSPAAPAPSPPAASAPARTAAPVTPPAPAPPSDQQVIGDTLQRYDAAYEALDIPALLRVFPSLDQSQIAQLRKTFEGMASYEMDTRAGRIDVTGDTATVQATVARRMSPRIGAPIANEVATVFQLRRAGTAWVITAVKAR
jgi:hypothetical protein